MDYLGSLDDWLLVQWNARVLFITSSREQDICISKQCEKYVGYHANDFYLSDNCGVAYLNVSFYQKTGSLCIISYGLAMHKNKTKLFTKPVKSDKLMVYS